MTCYVDRGKWREGTHLRRQVRAVPVGLTGERQS